MPGQTILDLVLLSVDDVYFQLLYGRCLTEEALMPTVIMMGDNLILWCSRMGLSLWLLGFSKLQLTKRFYITHSHHKTMAKLYVDGRLRAQINCLLSKNCAKPFKRDEYLGALCRVTHPEDYRT